VIQIYNIVVAYFHYTCALFEASIVGKAIGLDLGHHAIMMNIKTQRTVVFLFQT
jgi:hypothetical protein